MGIEPTYPAWKAGVRGEKLGADKKSMAFSLYFQPGEKPFAADEVDRFVKKILGNLKFKLGIEIRE